jgi:anaerobic magnesium-protoporphyrin IX monomethyl ester cyclase
MKKILFIVLPYKPEAELLSKHKLRSFVAHPYGVLSIATYLKRNTDAIVKVFDCNVQEEYFKEVVRFNPDIVALSMMFDCSYKYVKSISSSVKDWNSNCQVVIGGAAATASYQTILDNEPCIDAVCYGEGELPFFNLITSIEGEYTFGDTAWAVRGADHPIRSKIENLDDVIDIDYSFIDPGKYPMLEAFSPFASPKKTHHQFFVVTSRGCPFKCSFCINSANEDKSMRYASVDKIIAHVNKLVLEFDMDVLTFYDDQILFNKKRAKELFRRLIPFNLRIECPNGLSVAFIDDELAGLMRQAGMDTVNLAIESGSPYVLNELIHKPLHIEQVKPVINILRKYDFWIQGYFVIGVPGETKEDRELTTRAIKDWGLDWACISNCCPTRGSEVYRICVEKGYIPKHMKIDDLDMNKFIITTPECTPEQLVKESYLINLDVNFVNNHRYLKGDFLTAMRAFQDVLIRYPDHAFAYYMIAQCASALFSEKVDNKEWFGYADYFELI